MLADNLSRFAYRKLLHAIEAKAVEYNVPVVYVEPRNTSKTCTRWEHSYTTLIDSLYAPAAASLPTEIP